MKTTSILLIDDHALFRAGLRMVLAHDIADTAFFEAVSLEDALSNAPHHLDVVLLDIHLNSLNGLSGLDGIAPVNRKWPLAPILILSAQDEPETVALALMRGAAGFVSKAEPPENIVGAINRVLRGEFSLQYPATINTPPRCLTPRQYEVLVFLHQGLSNKLIARELSVSENTVRRHVQDVLEFFGVVNRSEAVFAARRLGLID
jgi:DNA-binding NarL/FixJ family response regulator